MAKNNLLTGLEEQQARTLLTREGRRLEKIIKKNWQKYQASYSPSVYFRTGKTLAGIKLGNIFRLPDGDLGIAIEFDDDKMYHESYIRPSEPKGHAFMLISSGWKAARLAHRIGEVHRFTYYEGYDLIGKIISEYNSGKPMGIRLNVEWKGNKDYTK